MQNNSVAFRAVIATLLLLGSWCADVYAETKRVLLACQSKNVSSIKTMRPQR